MSGHQEPIPPLDVAHLRGWIGRTETQADLITPQLARAYAATVLDKDVVAEGGPVPQGLHWCLTPRTTVTSQLGPDGHPPRGDFLPPVALPRRMWAGGRLRFQDALHVGDAVTRRSTITGVGVKEGRTGTLCFVRVHHVIGTARGTAIEEEQDIVYRQATAGPPQTEAAPSVAVEPGPFHRRVDMSPQLLFRYSALTFNSHRIHYDRPYAMEVEHYEGLVVHGPLQAAMLLALAHTMRPERPCIEFSFRGVRPLIDTDICIANGAWAEADEAHLWTGIARDSPNMQAKASWR